MIGLLATMGNVLGHLAPRAFVPQEDLLHVTSRHGFIGLYFRSTGFVLPKGTTSVAFGGQSSQHVYHCLPFPTFPKYMWKTFLLAWDINKVHVPCSAASFV